MLIKLTDSKGQTQNSTQWGEGQTRSLPPTSDPQLCSGDVLHAYRSLNLALLLNPIHADISDPQIWEATGTPVVEDWDKVGCFSLTTTKCLPLPEWWANPEKRKQVQIRFAILCAEEVLPIFEAEFPEDPRPREAIEAAKEYLKNPTAAYAADAADAADAAAYAAAAAAYAADADADADAAAAYAASRAADAAAAARAAYAARAADAADAAAYAARAAAYAARAAADAARAVDADADAARDADAAADAGVKINFNELADRAMEDYLK